MNQTKNHPIFLDIMLGTALLFSLFMIRIVQSFNYYFDIDINSIIITATYLIFGLILPIIIILIIGSENSPLQIIFIPLLICGLLCPLFDGIWYTLFLNQPFKIYIYGGLIFGSCLGIIGSYKYFKKYDYIVAGIILLLGVILYIIINLPIISELLWR